MDNGFIMLSRDILEDEMYFSERFTRMQAFIDLCFLANFKERSFYKRGIKVDIKTGQLAKSEDELAERWRWSRNTVRKFLSELQESGRIEQQKSRLITVITIKNGLVVEQQIEQHYIAMGMVGTLSRLLPEFTKTKIVFLSAYKDIDVELGQLNREKYVKYRNMLAKIDKN